MNTIEQARDVAALNIEITFDDDEKKTIEVHGTGQNMRYLQTLLDRYARSETELAALKQQEPVAYRFPKAGIDNGYSYTETLRGEEDRFKPAWQKLYLAAGARPAPKQEPFDKDYEREQFEKWYCVGAFDFERDPIGSKLCGDQWAAWKERAKRAAPVQAQEQRKPLAMTEMVDAAMTAIADIYPPITRSQCKRIIQAAHNIKEQP